MTFDRVEDNEISKNKKKKTKTKKKREKRKVEESLLEKITTILQRKIGQKKNKKVYTH